MVRFAPFISAATLLSVLVSAVPNVGGNVDANGLVRRTQPSRSPTGHQGHDSSSGSRSAGYNSAHQGKQSSGTPTASTSPMQTSSASGYSGNTTPMYGSGSAPWAGSSYDDCVNQCVAQYGSNPSPYVPSPTMNMPSSSHSSSSKATHTVIVAPSQGVYRYIPFALNASVGDTIKFIWGADGHTVTKSSSLSPCNANQDGSFTSGVQNKGYVYTQVVNDTNPTFFHCAVPSHCSKGMFGIVNPPHSFGSNTSVSNMMSSLMTGNPSISAYASMINSATKPNNSQSVMAARWGGSIDMGSLPPWSHALVAENVLYTRNVLNVNPDLMKPDGTVDLSVSRTNPMMIPMDLSAAIVQADAVTKSSSTQAPPGSFVAASTAAPSTSSTSNKSQVLSASSTSNAKASNTAVATSPQIMVGLMFVLIGFLFVL